MSRAEELRALAERVEREGADRLLDGDVWWAVLTEERRNSIDPTGLIRGWIEKDRSAGKTLASLYCSSDSPPCKLDLAPTYTTSVDAAKTLEREGWAVVVNIAREGTACTVVDRPIPSVLGSAMSTGPHAEPRARVAAALRALAAEAERGEG